MTEIRLNGAHWQTGDDLYQALLLALQAPHWHELGLDALADTLDSDEVNGVRQPIHFVITGHSSMSPEARQSTEQLRELIADLRDDGARLSIDIED